VDRRKRHIDFYVSVNGSQLSTKVIMEHQESLKHQKSDDERGFFDHDAVVVKYTLASRQADVEGNIVPFTPSIPTASEIPDHLLHKLAELTVSDLQEVCRKKKIGRIPRNKPDLLLELYCLPFSKFTDQDFEPESGRKGRKPKGD
jgi:hypothetical protein